MKTHSVPENLSPWWRRSVALVFLVGMAVLIFISVMAYRHAPPDSG
jgi:nitric oxide reductase subunit B